MPPPIEFRAAALPPGGPDSFRGLFAGVEEEQPILNLAPRCVVDIGCFEKLVLADGRRHLGQRQLLRRDGEISKVFVLYKH